ncbi:type III glutamate--ammonia ligase [Enteractinococcus helveticum]|uniref:GS catalytic domain-containing protein n=1 Tax=Enteractinococcus helveticum TaxID=1837282 RepID=A0A1B7M009_9MICC|nr:type III glutamate--ammonia ligase [Enteractinococcus helveticum]OAV61248.1 hypothetical protein A6F49_09790 [Enteractinococcus helveticum]
MIDSREKLKAQAEKDGIEFFMAMGTEVNGKPNASVAPAQYIDDLLDNGAAFAGFASGGLWQEPSDGDIAYIPDPSTYTQLPWRKEMAVLMSFPHVNGELWPYASQNILKRLMEEVQEEFGWTYKTGMEPEFFLVKHNDDGSIRIADSLDTSVKPCYHAYGIERSWPYLSKLSRYINKMGWGNPAIDSEDGNGQYEINIDYSDAMTTSDRLIMTHYMAHSVAFQEGNGVIPTFMGKPFTNNTGNGLNTHFSLWDQDGCNIFQDDNDRFGLSKIGYHFIAGVLANARGMQALIGSNVNAYKRIGVPHPSSGSTWTPTHVMYGGNNRTTMLRIPDGGRVEHRGVDGGASPHLASAAILAAGIDGIRRELDPGECMEERNTYTMSRKELADFDPLPATLWEAANELQQNDIMRKAMGSGPHGDFVDFYAEEKRKEFALYHNQVTQWEIDNYLMGPMPMW